MREFVCVCVCVGAELKTCLLVRYVEGGNKRTFELVCCTHTHSQASLFSLLHPPDLTCDTCCTCQVLALMDKNSKIASKKYYLSYFVSIALRNVYAVTLLPCMVLKVCLRFKQVLFLSLHFKLKGFKALQKPKIISNNTVTIVYNRPLCLMLVGCWEY